MRPDAHTAWPAPAKLNLLLRITGQRTDGYHELQTVFQFLDHSDLLHFRIRDDGRIRRQTLLAGVSEAADLTVRAAQRLQQLTGTPLGVDIRIDKRLPLGGGLGGGSSDAATTLLALNALWGTGISRQDLAELGLSLGADVPIFVHGHAAWAEGVGERFSPIDPPTPWYLVVQPPCMVSTAAVFGDPELTRNSSRITIRDFLAGEHGNDCLPTVKRRFPEIAQGLQWLGQFGEARMTGTGACLFTAFERRADAQAALAELPKPYAGFVARGLNESPVNRLLDTA